MKFYYMVCLQEGGRYFSGVYSFTDKICAILNMHNKGYMILNMEEITEKHAVEFHKHARQR